MAELAVLLFTGTSFLDRLIERASRSRFCHAAILDETTGTLYEALGSGVRKLSGLGAQLRAAQAALEIPVQVEEDQRQDAARFCEGEVGTRYPWTTCLMIGLAKLTGFAWDCAPANSWICSALVCEALNRAGALNVPDPQQISPGDLATLLQPDSQP